MVLRGFGLASSQRSVGLPVGEILASGYWASLRNDRHDRIEFGVINVRDRKAAEVSPFYRTGNLLGNCFSQKFGSALGQERIDVYASSPLEPCELGRSRDDF